MQKSYVITQFGKCIGVCCLFHYLDWCDKWIRWFLPEDSVETLHTPLSHVLITAAASPQGPGSDVKFWLIYSGFGMTPSPCPAEHAENYPWVFESIGERHKKYEWFIFCPLTSSFSTRNCVKAKFQDNHSLDKKQQVLINIWPISHYSQLVSVLLWSNNSCNIISQYYLWHHCEPCLWMMAEMLIKTEQNRRGFWSGALIG